MDTMWKVAAGILAGVLVIGALGGVWVGRNMVTRTEMMDYVANARHPIDADDTAQIKASLENIKLHVQSLSTQVSVLNAKLEAKGVLGGS